MVMVVGLLFYVVMTVFYIGDVLVDCDGCFGFFGCRLEYLSYPEK